MERCTSEGQSFAVETTLRTDVAIQQAIRAKAAGFRLEMIFVATENVAENVARVAVRGLEGGHSAPESTIREIYELSLGNLADAIDVFDEVVLYDTSAFDEPPRFVARFVNGKVTSRSPSLPAWCASAFGSR